MNGKECARKASTMLRASGFDARRGMGSRAHTVSVRGLDALRHHRLVTSLCREAAGQEAEIAVERDNRHHLTVSFTCEQ